MGQKNCSLKLIRITNEQWLVNENMNVVSVNLEIIYIYIYIYILVCRVDTATWIHYMDANKTYGEKA